jgi:hypothetical protein
MGPNITGSVIILWTTSVALTDLACAVELVEDAAKVVEVLAQAVGRQLVQHRLYHLRELRNLLRQLSI